MSNEKNNINMHPSPKLSPMTKEETLRLFEQFTGSMKVPADFDAKKEFLEYLDERYNQSPDSVNLSKMTKEQFDSKIQKSYNEMQEGKSRPAKQFFDELLKKDVTSPSKIH